jgi:hypothetical protein
MYITSKNRCAMLCTIDVHEDKYTKNVNVCIYERMARLFMQFIKDLLQFSLGGFV